ncbi:ferrous iron transport protein A [Amycolatopsis sp. cg5]|uniref:putative acetyltransferase n=1 Tax=Amycolatopsis sp. cg5 TaxID=3238802 RepID=UPI0035231D4E
MKLSFALGTRVVVRYRVEGGFTDALGYLRALDETTCEVETKRGLSNIALDDIVAAKAVPPPPARR